MTICQRWKQTALHNKLLVIGSILAVIVAGVYTANSVVQTILSEKHHREDYRPLVVFLGPVKLLGSISCDAKVGKLNTGPLQISVKNVGNQRAVTAFAMLPEMKLVPNSKTGDQRVDSLPSVTDESCKAQFANHTIGRPIAPGETIVWNVAQTGGAFRNPIMLDNTALLQFYITSCLSYEAEGGITHTACDLLRFSRQGVIGPDVFSFTCGETPLFGALQEAVTGHCAN
jgi:hypothetical protein